MIFNGSRRYIIPARTLFVKSVAGRFPSPARFGASVVDLALAAVTCDHRRDQNDHHGDRVKVDEEDRGGRYGERLAEGGGLLSRNDAANRPRRQEAKDAAEIPTVRGFPLMCPRFFIEFVQLQYTFAPLPCQSVYGLSVSTKTPRSPLQSTWKPSLRPRSRS